MYIIFLINIFLSPTPHRSYCNIERKEYLSIRRCYKENCIQFLGANAPLGPSSSDGLYVCLYVCLSVFMYYKIYHQTSPSPPLPTITPPLTTTSPPLSAVNQSISHPPLPFASLLWTMIVLVLWVPSIKQIILLAHLSIMSTTCQRGEKGDGRCTPIAYHSLHIYLYHNESNSICMSDMSPKKIFLRPPLGEST